jgi:hypothetical protein
VDDIERQPAYRGGPAWKAAEAHGFDMSLIEANLRRTPAERIRMHARVLALALALPAADEEPPCRTADLHPVHRMVPARPPLRLTASRAIRERLQG